MSKFSMMIVIGLICAATLDAVLAVEEAGKRDGRVGERFHGGNFGHGGGHGRGFGFAPFHFGHHAFFADKKLQAGLHHGMGKHFHAHQKGSRFHKDKHHEDIYFKNHIEFRHKKSHHREKRAHFDKKVDDKKEAHLKKHIAAAKHVKKLRGGHH